jgi:hypothetical protein
MLSGKIDNLNKFLIFKFPIIILEKIISDTKIEITKPLGLDMAANIE